MPGGHDAEWVETDLLQRMYAVSAEKVAARLVHLMIDVCAPTVVLC